MDALSKATIDDKDERMSELTERLRAGIASTEHRWPGNDGSDWTYDFVGTRKAMNEAADALEAQEAMIAKLSKALMRKGLMDGCDCGCRGDFVVTEKGCEMIGKPWHGLDI